MTHSMGYQLKDLKLVSQIVIITIHAADTLIYARIVWRMLAMRLPTGHKEPMLFSNRYRRHLWYATATAHLMIAHATSLRCVCVYIAYSVDRRSMLKCLHMMNTC